MKTRIREHKKQNEIQQAVFRNLDIFMSTFFPVIIGSILILLCLFVLTISIQAGNIMISLIFLFFSISGCYFMMHALKKKHKDYDFSISNITTNHSAIKNSYNYVRSDTLTSIAQKHIWKDLYSYQYSIVSILSLIFVVVTIIPAAFIMDAYNIKEAPLSIFITIFLPIIISIIFLIYTRRRFIKKIQNPHHNFLFHSLRSKEYYYSVVSNNKGGLDFIFQKKK